MEKLGMPPTHAACLYRAWAGEGEGSDDVCIVKWQTLPALQEEGTGWRSKDRTCWQDC